MDKKQKNKLIQYSIYSTLFVFVIFGFVCVTNYLSSKWFARIDLTEGKEYTITKATRNTLRNLDDIVIIKAFFSKKLPSQILPVLKQIRDILEEYEAYSNGNLRIRYLDPGEDPEIEKEARALGLQPIRMDAIEKDQRQIVTGYLGIAIQYEDKKELLPVVTDVRDLEYDLTAAIKKILRKEELKIGVLTGSNSTNLDSQCVTVDKELRKQYRIVKVNTSRGTPIDKSLNALLVMGPEKVPERTKFEIDQYIMSGGKALFFLDGVTIDYARGLVASPRTHNMDDLLRHYGARITQNIILDRSCGMASFQTQVMGGFTSYFTTPYPLWPKIMIQNLDPENPVVNRLSGLIMPWASDIQILADTADTANQIRVTELVKTSKFSWPMSGRYNLDPQGQFNAPPELMKQHTMAAALSGKFTSFYKGRKIPTYPMKVRNEDGTETEKDTLNPGDAVRKILTESPETRILLVGSSRFATEQFVQQSNGINLNFFLNAADWMAQDDDLVTIRSRKIVDRPLKKLTPAKRNLVKWANVIVMPILIILIGLIRMIVRNKKTQERKES